MKRSRCRYWTCSGCQAVFPKKDLAEVLRGQVEVRPGGKYRCPRCQTEHGTCEVYAGNHDVPRDHWDRLPAPVELPQEPNLEIDEERVPAREGRAKPGRARDQIASRDAAAPTKRGKPDEEPTWVELVAEEAEEEVEETDRKKRKGKERRKALGQVNVGLGIHYAGMMGFLLGQVAGWSGLVLLVISIFALGARGRDADPPTTLYVSGILFLASWGLIACATLTDLVSSIFCLWVPSGVAQGFLIGSLVTRLLAGPAGLVILLLGQNGLGVLVSAFLATLGWLLWMGFLHGLSGYLKQSALADEAVALIFQAIYLVVAWILGTIALVGILIVIVAFARMGGMFPCFFLLTLLSAVAGLIRVLLTSGVVDSLPMMLLYPTGIPLIMRYLDLIGSMRMIILRRS